MPIDDLAAGPRHGPIRLAVVVLDERAGPAAGTDQRPVRPVGRRLGSLGDLMPVVRAFVAVAFPAVGRFRARRAFVLLAVEQCDAALTEWPVLARVVVP